MKKKITILFASAAIAFAATADTYYWRATGESANWNTTDANWATSDSATERKAFVSDSDAYVYFDGGDSAATVNIDGS